MKIKYEDEKGNKYEILCVEEEMRAAAGDGEVHPEAIARAFGHHYGLRGRGKIKEGSIEVKMRERND